MHSLQMISQIVPKVKGDFGAQRIREQFLERIEAVEIEMLNIHGSLENFLKIVQADFEGLQECTVEMGNNMTKLKKATKQIESDTNKVNIKR